MYQPTIYGEEKQNRCPMTLFQRLAAVLGSISLPHGALAQTQAVYALSDAELKARGLKRRDAAHQIMINGDWS